MQTHTTSGADEVLASTAEGGPEDPLDSLLQQIVGGYFVLTDGQGSVSKWSEPAELLFGRPAQEVLGQSFFETLIQAPLPEAAQSWRGFLESGEPPAAPGRVVVQGLRVEGEPFPLEAVFIPVKLDEGFDFSLFLEDLGFELPQNLMLLRMRQQHPVVVRALRQALEPEPQPWDGWRTAGTLVVFRPTAPTPWVEEELAARIAARAEADAETEQRITNPDPGVQGSTVHSLDDAAAVVARLLSALERIDDLERLATSLPAQVQDARRDAESSRGRAEAAERETAQLRTDLQRALDEFASPAEDPRHQELLARMDRLEQARQDEAGARAAALSAAESARAELAARLESAEAERARAAEAIESRVAGAVAEAELRAQEALEEAGRRADGARSAFDSRIAELEQVRSGYAEAQQADIATRLDGVRAEHDAAAHAARHELAEALERIERERERDAEAARAELRVALERIELVQRESDGLREQLTQMTVERHEAEGLAGEERRRLEELAREAEQARTRIDALRESAEELRSEAAQAREEAAQVRQGHDELRAAQDDFRHGQDELREAVEAARHERDEVRASAEAAVGQLAEVRTALKEHEESISIQLPADAVEREEVLALVGEAHGEIAALRESEEALRGRLDELAGAGDAVASRLDEIAGEAAGARGEVDELREEAREAQRAARDVGERVSEIDRGAGSVLADVRAVRDWLEEVAGVARSAQETAGAGRADTDELRAAVARLTGELQVARGELERAGEEALGAREQAATAQEAATAAREDAGKVREDAAAMGRELETGRERLGALGTNVERLGESLGHLGQAAESAQTEATAARRTGMELTELVAELDQRATTLRGEMGAGRERLQALDTAIEQLGTEAAAAGESAGAARAAADAHAAALREELADVRSIAQQAAEGFEAMRAELEAVRGRAEGMVVDAKAARETVQAGEQRLEAMGAEVTFALKSLGDLKEGLTSAGQAAVIARREAEQAKKAAQNAGEGSRDNVTEVFQQLLGLAASKGGSGIHRRPSQPSLKKPEPVKREARHGFDDATQPLAMLGLDGKFRELNPAFARLVGYKEHEFAKATWPSPHDRPVYQQQQEQLTQLASGEIESVTVQSTYMHGQGLMVPVIGNLSAVPGEDGLPLHLLLEAEDRHHTH